MRTVARAAAEVGVDWFLVGAKARDWILELIHGIKMLRMTTDADIGIALAGWDEFERIRALIIDSGEFVAGRSLERLDHRQLNGFHIDLVPFGRVAGDNAKIAWPPNQYIVMNVIGFEEAFRSAITVLADVDLPVKVASLPGLMLMKIFAWDARQYDKGPSDAKDIRVLLTHYETAAGRSIHDVAGLMEAEDYDADRAVARLLGRDVAAILTPSSREPLLSILDHELSDDVAGHFIEQLSRGRGDSGSLASDPDDFRKMRALLASFRGGLDD